MNPTQPCCPLSCPEPRPPKPLRACHGHRVRGASCCTSGSQCKILFLRILSSDRWHFWLSQQGVHLSGSKCCWGQLSLGRVIFPHVLLSQGTSSQSHPASHLVVPKLSCARTCHGCREHKGSLPIPQF
jgi:hypothetical protein